MYTFITLLGDIGGFIEAVVVFPAIIMAFFSQKMYRKAIAEDMPVKDTEEPWSTSLS